MNLENCIYRLRKALRGLRALPEPILAGSFPKGEAKVDMEGQAQGHYVGIMLAEFQG